MTLFVKTLPPPPTIDTSKVDVEEVSRNGELAAVTFSGKGFNVLYEKRATRSCWESYITVAGETHRSSLSLDETPTEQIALGDVEYYAKQMGYVAQPDAEAGAA